MICRFRLGHIATWSLCVLSFLLSGQLAAFADKSAPKSESNEVPKAPAPPRPQGVYELRYKLTRGEVLRYEVSHRASVRSTIDETTQTAETRTASIKAWKVTDVLPNGEIEFMNVVERLHMVNQLPDRDTVEYDSTRDKTPPPGFEDAGRSVGVPLSVVRMTPRGKVVRRDVKIQNVTTDENGPIAVRLPENEVEVGDTWDEPFDIQVTLEGGGTKTIHTRRHHKLASVANGIATIEVTYQILSPVDSHIECQLVQRLMEGEVRFDIEAGRVVSQRMDIDKRILGFAGPTSSMHYAMRMEEKLLKPEEPVAAAAKPATPSAQNQRPASRTPTARSANRQRSQPSRGARR